MKEIPIWEKANLTLEEAAAYSRIGTGKLREITNDEDCNFVLWVGAEICHERGNPEDGQRFPGRHVQRCRT